MPLVSFGKKESILAKKMHEPCAVELPRMQFDLEKVSNLQRTTYDLQIEYHWNREDDTNVMGEKLSRFRRRGLQNFEISKKK